VRAPRTYSTLSCHQSTGAVFLDGNHGHTVTEHREGIWMTHTVWYTAAVIEEVTLQAQSTKPPQCRSSTGNIHSFI
jgi:hypothetical protein